MSAWRPSIVALAGGKFQRAHGMSFCGGSANVPALSGVTGLSAANAAGDGGAPPAAAAGPGTTAPAARAQRTIPRPDVRFTLSPPLLFAVIDHDRPRVTTELHGARRASLPGEPSTSPRSPTGREPFVRG